MDDNDDRKAKENDKIYKIIFENKNTRANIRMGINRSEEHTSELQSQR